MGKGKGEILRWKCSLEGLPPFQVEARAALPRIEIGTDKLLRVVPSRLISFFSQGIMCISLCVKAQVTSYTTSLNSGGSGSFIVFEGNCQPVTT